ncbi:MAG: major facilitator superfamily 1 [Sphingomonas bacterium]|nr:major facilitator superfamily 1 [Sphingomonas bacterium]
MALIAPVVPLIAEHFRPAGQGELAAQLVAVFPFLGLLLGGLASGWSIPHAGLRPFILIAAGAYATSGVIGLFAPTLTTLLIGCGLLGFGAAFLMSGLSAMTSIVFDGAERGRIVGLQSAIGNLFNVALGIGTAFLAERLGWRTPFGVFLAFGAVMLLLSARAIPKVARSDAGGVATMGWVLRRTWPICLAGGAIFLLAATQSTQLPFLLANNGVTSAGMRAVVATFTTGAAMLGSLVFSAVQGKVGERVLILIAAILSALGWAIFGIWSGGLAVAFLASALLGAGLGLLLPILFSGAMRAAPGEASGQAVGLLNTAIFLGSFLNPVLTAPLAQLAGRPGLMLLLAALSLAVGAVALAWPRGSHPTSEQT